MKRAWLISLGFVLSVCAGLYVFRVPLALGLMERVVARGMATTLLDGLEDGLHVGFCGAGSPLPDPKRSGPCVAVIAGDRLYIVDSGAGSTRILGAMRIPYGEIDGILLTHYHSDHIDGLGELQMQRWVNSGSTSPVPVYGPGPDVRDVVDGLNLAYGASRIGRTKHHSEAIVPASGAGAVAVEFPVPPIGFGEIVLEKDGLKITAFLVDHAPVEPAVGYRFDYKGRSVLISGDTKKSANLQKFAKGVDLLVHEALSKELVRRITDGARAAGRTRLVKITSDILDYHASPTEAAEIARDSDVGHLVFHHIVPPLLLSPMEDAFLEGVDDVYEGPVTLSRDGTFVEMNVGSDSIKVRQLL